MVLVGSGSVSFDPDSESSHIFIRIRIQGNYTDSTDPDQPHFFVFNRYSSDIVENLWELKVTFFAWSVNEFVPYESDTSPLLGRDVDPRYLFAQADIFDADPDPDPVQNIVQNYHSMKSFGVENE